MSDESLAEIEKSFGKRSTYLSSTGGFKSSTSTDTIDLVLANITG